MKTIISLFEKDQKQSKLGIKFNKYSLGTNVMMMIRGGEGTEDEDPPDIIKKP